MDRLSARQKPDAEALMALQPRASNLENAVCLFRSRHSEGSPSMSASPNSAPGGTPHMHMVRALASALVFFYRRIRKVNPLVLQDSVNDVVDSLHAFDEALERNNLLGPGTAWPAFIAGAEARGRQRSLSRSGWTRDFRGVDLRVINLRRRCLVKCGGGVTRQVEGCRMGMSAHGWRFAGICVGGLWFHDRVMIMMNDEVMRVFGECRCPLFASVVGCL
jgi:hypothetical protein